MSPAQRNRAVACDSLDAIRKVARQVGLTLAKGRRGGRSDSLLTPSKFVRTLIPERNGGMQKTLVVSDGRPGGPPRSHPLLGSLGSPHPSDELPSRSVSSLQADVVGRSANLGEGLGALLRRDAVWMAGTTGGEPRFTQRGPGARCSAANGPVAGCVGRVRARRRHGGMLDSLLACSKTARTLEPRRCGGSRKTAVVLGIRPLGFSPLTPFLGIWGMRYQPGGTPLRAVSFHADDVGGSINLLDGCTVLVAGASGGVPLLTR